MSAFLFRTEDIKPDEVLNYFVETTQDRRVVDALKGKIPSIIVGSRGVGKSFLLRVAQAELKRDMNSKKVFPVYVSFTRGTLIQTAEPDQFKIWMLARICSQVLRDMSKEGLLALAPRAISLLSGGESPKLDVDASPIERLAREFEDSWKNPGQRVDISIAPDIDQFKNAVEDLCSSLEIDRIAIFIDEAAHILLPEQQRQFFTLFRDLRSPYITCNAAVYPGVTAYGEIFQPAHDAAMLNLDRDLLAPNYIENMKEIVQKQADSSTLKNITKNGKNFAVLAYAANGNPRILLKTLERAPYVTSSDVNEVIKTYYRDEIWSEHSLLAEKYMGHRAMVDWGRHFIENVVLPLLKQKNEEALKEGGKTSVYFWVHRDTPQTAKEAIGLLAYTGIVTEQGVGIKATRKETGTRYSVNFGCLLSLESSPTLPGLDIARNLTLKWPSEFGANHQVFKEIADINHELDSFNMTVALQTQLAKSVDVLDLSLWQREKLKELGLNTIGDVLRATEEHIRRAFYVGETRSRRARNAAEIEIFEYLSG